MLVSSRELLYQAQETGSAVAQFNVWSCAMLFGVLDAIEAHNSPAILATGPSFLPPRELTAFSVMLLKTAESSTVPLSVHWDHAKRPEEIRTARELGFTSAMIDGSQLPLWENLELTLAAKKLLAGSGISLEGELGYIGEELGRDADTYRGTTPEDALRYVKNTGADALAVAIGNAHGAYNSPPRLRYDVLKQIRQSVDVPLVLHGGSGIPDEGLRKAITLGIAKINFHTELCQAAAAATTSGSYRAIFDAQRLAIAKKAEEKLLLTANEGKTSDDVLPDCCR